MIDHFLITDLGDVTEPDGYSPSLSAVVINMTHALSDEYALRVVGTVRKFLNFVHTASDTPRAVIEEAPVRGFERAKAFLLSMDIVCIPSKKANCEHELELKVPNGRSTVHAQSIVGILRQFYQLCGTYHVGNRTAENPIELPDWHLKGDDERRESWDRRHPQRKFAWIYAGLRFCTTKRRRYLPLIEDPTGCGEKMTRAAIAHGCPATVIAICMTLEENGCRWREAAWANALGWSIKGFGEIVYTTNKHDDDEHAKRIMLPPDVLSGVIERFQGQPHPRDGSRTMMDHIRELAAAGDKDRLRQFPLFPNSRGRFHQHRTFNGHWFAPAMKAWVNEDGSKGLLIFSDVSARRPTPHWYRHAEISRDLEEAIVSCETEADVLEVSKRVCRSFSLDTDQAKRYAAALMRRLADEDQMRRIARRRAANAARRAQVDLPIAVGRLEISEAELLISLMPARARVRA